MKIVSVIFALVGALPVFGDDVDGKFNCVFKQLNKEKKSKEMKLASTSKQSGNFYFEGVQFVVSVDEKKLVSLGARWSDKNKDPFVEAIAQDAVWLTVMVGDRKKDIFLMGACELDQGVASN